MKTHPKIIVSILVVVLVIGDVYGILRMTWQAPVSLRVGELTPRSADISLRCNPSMIECEETTTIDGNLHSAISGSGISYQTLDLYYRPSFGTSWIYIMSVSTAYEGGFSYYWSGSAGLAAGFYVVNATFSGNGEFDRWSSLTDVQVTPVPSTPQAEIADSFRFPLDGSWTPNRDFGRWYSDLGGYCLGDEIMKNFEVPVFAPANGMIKVGENVMGYGGVVIIEHRLQDGSFVCSVLSHLRIDDRATVGSPMAKGRLIGHASSIASENGGHNFTYLHFGIRKGEYSTAPDRDGQWRYREYGPADIVDLWFRPSGFTDYYNVQKTPALPGEEGLRVKITSDKSFYQVDETINFNVTVTNPTNETGINIVAHNSSLTIDPPAEIELENPQTFHDLGDINPGESKTLSFNATAKKVGALLKTWAKAAAEDLQLGLSMAGACLRKLSIGNTIPTEWSFAVITDLHIGRPGCSEVEGRLRQAISSINLALKDAHNIKFVLVLGDITDLGGEHLNSDFEKAREILNSLNDPNQDGNMEDGIPYIPLIGNHDIKKDGEPHFNLTFWGSGNEKNQQLIDATVDDFDLQDQDSLYLQNCYFSYDGLDFLCLDFAARDLIAEIDPTGVYPTRTSQYLRDHFGLNSGERFVLASHFPLYEFGGFPPQSILESDIDAYNCNVTNFAGHTHRNYETLWSNRFRVIETEAVAQVDYEVIWDFPKPIVTGNTIRIVEVKNGEIDDYSTLENPEKVLEEYRAFWEHIAFFTVEGFGSYLEPNKPAIFTAYYPIHHGFETSFQWTFDDGDSGSGVTVSHSYLQEGDYDVALNITRRNLITNETVTTTLLRSLCVRTKHIISLLPLNSYAASFPSAVDLTEVPTNMHFPVLFGKNSSGGRNPVAVVGVHFEDADANIDFSNLVLDTDTRAKKSIVFSSSWPVEADCGKWLFVPSSGAGSVYICLDATSLNDVTLENADFVVNDGETVNNITVTSVYYGAKKYYLVYGNVSGLGGGEIFHDIALANVTVSKTIIGKGFSLRFNVTVENPDPFTETFNITIYANTTMISTLNITLASGTSSTIAFTWNTAGWAEGNYTLSAYAEPVPGETTTANNNLTGGTVKVTILGDVDGNFLVNIFDVVKITSAYGKRLGDPLYNPNADIDGNGVINILDVVVCTSHYGQKWP